MDYLARNDAPFSKEEWEEIDKQVVKTIKENLVGRKFIPVFVQGAGMQFTKIDSFNKEEEFKDNYVATAGRKIVELPQIYHDFWINWRDIAASKEANIPLDLSQPLVAAEHIARKEDEVIFYGIKELGLEGLVNAKGVQNIKISDWTKDENAFLDVAKAIDMLESKGRYGKHTLIVSSDLYIALQRIQPGTGEVEAKRIGKMIDHCIIKSTVLEKGTAILVSAQSQYIDYIIGQDLQTGYIEAMDFNHHFRIVETAALRIKAPEAIVVIK